MSIKNAKTNSYCRMTCQEEEVAHCSAVRQYLYRKADNLDHKLSRFDFAGMKFDVVTFWLRKKKSESRQQNLLFTIWGGGQ